MSLLRQIKQFFSPPKQTYVEEQVVQVHNLKQIYDELNHQYFAGELTLSITWFGRKMRSRRIGRKVLGYYDGKKKSIKIHRSLDHGFFPPYFLAYVVYHEMLHSVEPPLKGRKRRRVHHATFRHREKQFHGYEQAKDWEKQNLAKILSRREGVYGGS